MIFENYNVSLDAELVEMLNDSDEEIEMYFKDSNSLQELFEKLE